MDTIAVALDCRIAAKTEEELDRELSAIRSRMLAALGHTRSHQAKAATHHPAGRSRSRARPPQRLRRATRGGGHGNGHVTDEQMLSALEGRDGITGRELGEELGVSGETALRKLREWEKAGKVFRQGERNHTRWFARQPAIA